MSSEEVILLKKRMVEVEAVTQPVHLGEGPYWSNYEEALYYVDIFNQNVHRYHPASNHHTKLHIDGGPVTFVIPYAKMPNTFVVSIGSKIVAVKWPNPEEDATAGGVVELASVDQDLPGNRFNDAKCDSYGRLWAGTMGNTDLPDNSEPDKGSLYCMNAGGKVKLVKNKISLSNGLAWDDKKRKFYFVDSCAFKIFSFDYDEKNAILSNQRDVIDYKKVGLYPAFPDGMTIDKSGKLWVASMGTGKIHCVNPETGEIERFVGIPAPNVTSVAWGGKNSDEMYVTTTTKTMTKEQLKQFPLSGAVFRILGLDTNGFPASQYDSFIS